MCWQWTIFPDRRQSSIFASAELNFCVRNGNRWTLCDKITNSKAFDLVLYQQWTIFPDRRQSSIFAPAELNFCVRNGNRWTLCGNITDYNGSPNRARTCNPPVNSRMLYHWAIEDYCKAAQIVRSAFVNFSLTPIGIERHVRCTDWAKEEYEETQQINLTESLLCWLRPIFPDSFPSSIFGTA